MDLVLKRILSIKSAIIFLFMFGFFSGFATFIENDFGVETSWALIYTSWWFEFIQIALGIILVYNIVRYKMYTLDKLPSFLFHLSFIFILIGSGVTRYFGFEGSLHVRNGMQENRITSSDSFISATALKDNKTYQYSHPKLISQIGSNHFSFSMDVGGEMATVKFKDYFTYATKKVVDDASGIPMISMILSGYGESLSVSLKEGERYETNEYIFSFNAKPVESKKEEVRFMLEDGKFYFSAPSSVAWFKMVENERGEYESGKKHDFTTGQLYTIGHVNFAPRYIGLKGKEKAVADKTPMNKNAALSAVIVDVTYQGESKEIALFGQGKGSRGEPVREMIGGVPFMLEWGSKLFTLPFYIKLNEFQLERYPGSMSPMSYASEVEVVDTEKGIHMPFRIYMNHVLDYRGFRFFQSSYDKDERGTILSVNNDPGKLPTYFGYILLCLGLFFNLLNTKSRFRKLASMVQKDMVKVKSLFIALACGLTLFQSPLLHADTSEENVNFLKRYDTHHADKFGHVLVQGADGRFKPIDTISMEMINKVYTHSSYEGLSANQVALSMMSSPAQWQGLPIVKVFHPELKKILGIAQTQKYASFNDFFNKEGDYGYKLTKYSEEANRKKPALRNQFDKDVLKVDERVNICYMVYTGEIFRMIPKQNDVSKRWFAPQDAVMRFSKQEGDEVRALVGGYFEAISTGLQSGNWEEANKAVEKLSAYQEQYGSDIIPNAKRIKAEIFFNHAQIFERLTPVYLLSGLVLLCFIFAKMINSTLRIGFMTRIVLIINAIAFLIHSGGLALRWYIAMHAPWSNGYESMIYIAWAIVLAGIFFSRQSIVSLALTSILAGVTLFVAHLSWMDPQITNLVPVLNSYWLNIHVSVITASYGFLGLCALLGFFTLILFAMQSTHNIKRNKELERNIVEATRINEMSMILGLSLLTVGNFLGGVWANESWGRYWGWDPKETWALVSILIYAGIVHFRFVPKWNNPFTFAVASTLSFASIIMTYFGVNFYLSGMHSYAAGDPVPVPSFVYYTIGVVALVIALSYSKRDIGKTL
ncbi:cytochrome c biogenesis protein [Sulfurospirillum barnesii]|uniref:ABC-type transport system involved in cytochrome c biogenesis, permease component n=1 Tax=Sulfurospirillum barnesii (strain ATCC 700032 / DSM 10660 / SES-3) TaxID=760154 RepID=I3XV70_SULBS|nr:cytochrome c biogenesis protein CcsA [Sulfurospirillum barnesii]AFL67844.1 ABC-type transport system involved in cytochrome c biogenesis, permease component [Sulfurospirillum barnesii SES-3]